MIWLPAEVIAALILYDSDSDAQQQAEADAAADSADLEREVSQGAWPR